MTQSRSSRSRVSAVVVALVATLLTTALTASPASAATPAVTSTSTNLVAPTGTTALTGVTVSGYTNETLLVNVSTTIGTLSMTTTTGLSLTYGYSSFTGATLSFTGTQANVNTGLATLRYNGNGSTGTAAIAINTTVNQAGISYFPTTGHYYQYVATPGLAWTTARSQAVARTFNGQSGYLARIGSSAVNSFVQSKINGAQNVWAGGLAENNSGATIKRNWKWQGGPFGGTSFTQCTNLTGGCTHSGDSGSYYNWNSGEPNNSGSNESYLEINYQGNGSWNDLANGNTETSGYVVEYGDTAVGGNFTGVYSASSNVTVAAAPGAPTAVTAVRGDSKATVSWTAPASNGGAAITGYSVTAYTGGSEVGTQEFATNATSQEFIELSNGVPYTFTVKATNVAGTSAASSASSAATPAGLPGTPTTVTATAGAGQATVSWTAPASNGAAITGYTVTPYLGTVAQTPRVFGTTATSQAVTGLTNGNAYTFKVQATNTVGTGAMSTASSGTTPGVAPLFTAYGPPAATGGQAYSYTFAASGSPAPSYALASGSLPTGLTLNSATGVLSGTPTSGGTFTIRATNSTGNVTTPTVTISYSAPVAPAFTDASPPSATNGLAYSYTFKATGNPAPTYAVQSGALPTGLTLNSTTGVLSGTPTSSSSFTVSATNSAGVVSASASIVTYAQAAPAFSGVNLPRAYTGVPYTYTLQASGSPTPTYSVFSGALPAGLTLNANTGVISGTPTGATGTFVVRATNVLGTANTASLTLTPTAPVAPTFTAANPGPATSTFAYSYTFEASGSPAPTFSSTGTLPTGLTLNSATGVLSGTPSASGMFTVTATNAAGSVTTDSITIISATPAPPTLTLTQMPVAVLSTPFTYTATADGSPAPTFSIGTGTLPAGLTLNPVTGVISGTPTGSGTFTIRATNSLNSAESEEFTLDPGSPVTVTLSNQSPPMGAIGQPYSYQFKALGNPAPQFSVVNGALPTGLSIDPSSGIVSGSPSALGDFTFDIVADNTVTSDTTTVTITVAAAEAPVFVNAAPPSAINGQMYSYTFTVAGNPMSTFSVPTGALPTGLTLNTTTGVISGTPTANGTFTISATNGVGSATTQSITIVVNPLAAPVFVGSITPPPAVAGSAYSYTFVATGVPTPTYTVGTGTLPTGLSLNATTGVLSGTPTAGGTFTITATNSQGSDTTPSMTIAVAAASAPVFVDANPPAGFTTLPYSYRFVATGNLPPTYVVATGSLPTGLTLDPVTGLLSGTPTASGTFTLSAVNATSTVTTGSITIPVSAASVPVLTSTAPSLVAVNGLAYSYRFTATGGPTPTFSVQSGDLPAGLTLNSVTGVLSGTPTTTASSTFTIRASNSQGNDTSASVTLNVTASAAPTFLSVNAPDATNTIPYSFTVGVSANPLPTFAIATGSLPAGLTLNAATGEISGISTGQGTSTFTVTATNAFGSVTSGSISITAQALATPLFVNATPPSAAVTTLPYSYTFTATGTPAPTFSVATGTLPAGLTLNSITGVLSGTPTATGVSTFTINAHNTSGDLATSTLTITTSAPEIPAFVGTPTPLTAATQTVPYSYSFAVSGTPAPTYSVASGTLPDGLSLNTTTGVLSGTPTTLGSYTFIIAATNTFGTATTSPITITTNAPAAPTVLPGSTPPSAINGQPYSYTIPASGSPAPTFAVATGSLPPGLTLNPNTGTISGTPTGPGTFTISITNSLGTITTGAITIGSAVAAAPVFSAMTPPPAYNTFAYSYTFVANGYPAPTYAVSSGSLPAGLNLDSTTGLLSGTPTGSGTATFIVTATNSSGSASTGLKEITTTVPVTPTFGPSTPLPNAIVGTPFTYSFPSNGNPAPVYAVASGSLPLGVTLDSATGVLSGTPSGTGTFIFTISITNPSGTVVSDSITIVTTAAPTGGSIAAMPTGAGYWSLSPTGTLSNFGNAPDLGSMNGKQVNAPMVAVASTSTGDGYWELASDGGVFTFGNAGFHGSMGGQTLNQPMVSLTRTADNMGYWLVASDGGVFAFGSAPFYGSMGGQPLNQKIVGIAVTPTGRGYWLVGADGGVFAYGDAQFFGSLGAINLNKRIIGIAATPDGNGYWLAAADGGVFAYGNAPFYGSLGGDGRVAISGIIANGTQGYRLIGIDGKAYPFGVTQ